jgi:virginiamycin B lyase
MRSRLRFLLWVALWMLSLSLVSRADASAFTYLQSVSDQFQQTIDVYTDADAAGNHFAARGEFDARSAGILPAMDEISTNGPCLGITCLTASYNPAQAAWGGWYFMNGILGSSDREPTPNWGTVPSAGYDASGATAVTFMARGSVGGEAVTFFCCGVGYNPDTGSAVAPFPDSARKVATSLIHLTTSWTQYTIPLTGIDLHYTLGGFGWVAVGTDQPGQRPITFYLDNIQFVRPRPNDPRLLVSYQTIKSTSDFDIVERNAAFVYDNSVALIALLGQGDITRAQSIADALVYAQNNDRYFIDGRVRNAYQGGDIALPPGWIPNNRIATARMPGWYDPTHATWYEDETQVSSNTGNIAWTALALLDMWETTGNSKYLTAAQTLGNWIITNTSEQRGGAAGALGGFTGGYDGWEKGAVSASAAGCVSGILVNGQCKRLYKSTEHNIDLYSVFMRLYKADGSPQWGSAAQQAKHFFLSAFDRVGGKFWTGTGEDGATFADSSTDVIPVDIQAWSLQALGSESGPYVQALNYIESHHKTSLGYGFKQNDTANSCGNNTWFEGTSQVALSYLLTGNQSKWQSILAAVHSVQTSAGGVPATDGACLNTGFTLDDGSPWEYFPRIHVGASGWLSLAENNINPYKSNLYSPQLSASTLSFSNQTVGTKSSAQTLTLSNPGALPLTVQSVSVSGAASADFTQTNTCGNSLAAGGNCSVSVVFTPSASGARNAAATITEISDPAMAPAAFTVALSGSGTPGTQLAQTITFGALNNQVLGTAAFALSATASSGLAVTFASNTTSVCTVSGATLTLIAVGTCSITASQTGNASYAAATPVTQSFAINLPAAGGPSITPGGIVPVDSTVNTIQPGEWVSIYGSNFALSPVGWNGNFPTSLGGVSVRINGKLGYLSYVSPTQLNLQAPNDTATGPVPVVVTTPNGSATATVTLAAFAPSFLLLDSKHVAGIISRLDGSGAYGGGSYDIIGPTGSSLGYPTVAAKPGDVVSLFALGLGPTNPPVLPGQVFSGAAPVVNPVNLLINNQSVTPSFIGLASAGLYQINFTVPVNLGTGDLALSLSVGGTATPAGNVIALAGVVSLAPSVAFSFYAIPTANSSPFDITTGPDGALWFTEASGNKIGRITTAGAIKEYNLPTGNAYPERIATGSDGALWFVEYSANKMGRITTSGAITEYTIPPSVGSAFQPGSIAAGPDGALWFTGLSNNIGRITTSGAFSAYPAHASSGGVGEITAGPDQALWFADYTTGNIGRITTSGRITEFQGGGGGGSITNGPDGALWFTSPHSGIGRITTTGDITLYNTPGGPAGITTGPDGALWVTEFSGAFGVLGRITPAGAVSGAITYYNIAEPNYPKVNEFGALITLGQDGALWIADYVPNLIVKATLTPVAPSASLPASLPSGTGLNVKAQ